LGPVADGTALMRRKAAAEPKIKGTPKGAFYFGAGDEARTRYLHLGKVALYQMSYARISTVY
jgi:hypothetical protein